MENKLRIAIPVLEDGYENYRDALNQLGAQPVLIRDVYESEGFDGLLVPGGGDVDPELYNQPNRGSYEINRRLDDFQLEMIKRFIADGKPIIGICRGHQLINIALGGTLVQDIASKDIHTPAEGEEDKVHKVKACKESFISEIYGSDFMVNSWHHQVIDTLGDGLEAILLSNDGLIEACHHKTMPIYTVQFHPERMCFKKKRKDTIDGSVIFRFFLKKCENT